MADADKYRETRHEPHWFNTPNFLTFVRVLLVPVILWLLTIDDVPAARMWAFGVFIFAAATDSVDGWVARRFNGVTRWGQLADPIADKFLVIGVLASLAFVGELPWWAVIIIVSREIAVTLLRLRLVAKLSLVMPASIWGKVKTVAQMIAIGAYLAPIIPMAVSRRILDVAVVLTIWSGIEFAFRARQIARARDHDPHQ